VLLQVGQHGCGVEACVAGLQFRCHSLHHLSHHRHAHGDVELVDRVLGFWAETVLQIAHGVAAVQTDRQRRPWQVEFPEQGSIRVGMLSFPSPVRTAVQAGLEVIR